MGVFFSAGWIPCVGPVLAAIYLLASDTDTVGRAALLLLVYALGLGIPFLITGAALGTASGWLRSMNRHLGLVSKITGHLPDLAGHDAFQRADDAHQRVLCFALRHRAGQLQRWRVGLAMLTPADRVCARDCSRSSRRVCCR